MSRAERVSLAWDQASGCLVARSRRIQILPTALVSSADFAREFTDFVEGGTLCRRARTRDGRNGC